MSPPRAASVQTYYLCETLTGFLLAFMLVFSPWAFGTTEPWSIWTMNGCGYVLGLLWILKRAISWSRGYYPNARRTLRNRSVLMVGLGLCSMGIPAYCLLSALNARATYDPASMSFIYHNYMPWLPASFDQIGTWQAFANLVSMACSFWALSDWLLDSSASERRAGLRSPIPARLKGLIWVLAISGGLLGLEGIVQRLCGSPKLLFLVTPEIHREAVEQFGSFAYRANAAQYFNLLWPVCLGFWWTQYGSIGLHRFQGRMLLGACAVMAACPIISSARGAALVDLALLFISVAALCLLVIFGSSDQRPAKLRLMVMSLVFVGGALALALMLGWNHLGLQFRNLEFGLAERERLYNCAERIVADYPLFGTGPGTFEKVFQLYRGSAEGYWPAQLHNDWLETKVTYGWVGSGMIALAMALVLLSVVERVRRRQACHLDHVLCLSLFGCLVQARFDFPLQVYSIMFLWVVWCSVLFGNASSGHRSIVTA